MERKVLQSNNRPRLHVQRPANSPIIKEPSITLIANPTGLQIQFHASTTEKEYQRIGRD